MRLLPPLQVAAVEAVSAEAEARLQSQAQVHDTAVEQLQQERKREKEVCDEKLQEQVDELTSCLLCCASSNLMLTYLVNGS